ncbi:hypothetical protein COO72_02385 [Bifidobacterium callitrichos]|nr:hypothetical protein COO72_02385 [Bifidobacterium callitrichos]
MTEPFWQHAPIRTLINKAVRVTYASHAVAHGVLEFKPVSTDRGSGILILVVENNRDASVTLPVVTVHTDGRRELADPNIVSVMIEPANRITRVERVDNPAKWKTGDIIVLKDGSEWIVLNADPGQGGTLHANYSMLGIESTIPKAYVDHALRPHPILPDKPGLWRSLVDDGLYIVAPNDNRLTARAIRDSHGDWTIGTGIPVDSDQATHLAPFLQLNGRLDGDWIDTDTQDTTTGKEQ